MSKKAKEIRTKKIKIISFWAMISFITLAFITVLIVLIVETRPIKTYSDLRREQLTLKSDQMFKQEATSYYVYVYSSHTDNELIAEKAEVLEPTVFNYFNFVKRNSRNEGLLKIYGFDVSDFDNISCLSDTVPTSGSATNLASFSVKENSLPLIVKVVGAKVSYSTNYYTEIAEIINELQQSLDIATELLNHQAIIIPKKRYQF